MEFVAWIGGHWEVIGKIGAVVYAGASIWAGVRVKQAEVAMDINKQHRELVTYYQDHPELHALKKRDRDMKALPLTREEASYAGSLFDHLRVTVRFHAAGALVQPECLRDDIRGFLSYPAAKEAWDSAKRFHDRRFVRFVERSLVPKRSILRECLAWLGRE